MAAAVGLLAPLSGCRQILGIEEGKVYDAAAGVPDAALCAEEGEECPTGGVCFEGVCGGGEIVQADDGCAVRRSGSLWCWGRNQYGRVGSPPAPGDVCVEGGDSVPCRFEPVRVSGVDGVRQVTSGGLHVTCALGGSGDVWCWGLNDVGQLGHDPAGDDDCDGLPCSAEPRAVDLPSGIEQVSAGGDAVCAVARGEVHCWGSNATGVLGTAPGGLSFLPRQIGGLPDDIVQVAVGGSGAGRFPFACARSAGGQVWCWGSNRAGALGHSGGDALCADSVESLCNPTPRQVDELLASEISAGEEEVMCARELEVEPGSGSRTVHCWGHGGWGILGAAYIDGSSSAPVKLETDLPRPAASISVGRTHACVIDVVGAVRCWGVNEDGELGNLDVPGDEMCKFERCETSPQPVAGVTSTVAVAGDQVGLAISLQFELWVWGRNDVASLAHQPGTESDDECDGRACNPSPTAVPGLP